MQQIQTILVDIPQDFSELTDEQLEVLNECLKAALNLASCYNAKLILFSHVYAVGIALDTWLQGTVMHNAREEMEQDQHKLLKRLAVKLQDDRVKAKSVTIETKAIWSKHLDDGLIKAFDKNLPDLVIQPSQHHLFAAAIIRQPNEWRMIRMPKVPVILQQEARPLIGKVLLAIDVGEAEEEAHAANHEMIRQAKEWCNATQSELHLINAYPSVADLMAFAPAEWTVPQIQSTLKSQHMERLQELARTVGIDVQRVHVGEGPVAQVISLMAEKLDADLVILSSHCRRGMSAFFIGNTAEIVLEQTQCNLLVLKPGEE